MARPERFELPTYSSGGCRSIQLSYGRTPIQLVYIDASGGKTGEGTCCIRLGLVAASAASPATPTATVASAVPATAASALHFRTSFIHV